MSTPPRDLSDGVNAKDLVAALQELKRDSTPEPLTLRDALAADNFEWSSLYNAVSHLMARLGADGSISTDAAEVERVMDALHRLDAGQFVPGLTPRAALAQSDAQPEPMFWVRLCSDGMYEGPIHNAQIEKVRRMSGAWSPLYLGVAPDDPLDTPLPCDVKVGNGTHRKGTTLRTLVARMKMLHEAAFGPELSQAEKDANLAVLQGVAQPPQEAQPATDADMAVYQAIADNYAAQPARERLSTIGHGELWSFLRTVIGQGVDIAHDAERLEWSYEARSARLDAAAAKRADELHERIVVRAEEPEL